MKSTLKAGWGYWDVTQYPYGGKFCRAEADTAVTVIGPGAKPFESKVSFADGRVGIVDKRALVAVPAGWDSIAAGVEVAK